MRLFAIILVILQVAVSLFLVGWILARAGLLKEPFIIVAIGLTGLAALAATVRARINRRRRPDQSLTEENA